MAEPWMSGDGIAAHLGVARYTVNTLVVEKAMSARKVGHLWSFRASEVHGWVRRGGASASTPDQVAG